MNWTRKPRLTATDPSSRSQVTRNWMTRSGIWTISSALRYSGWVARKGSMVEVTSWTAWEISGGGHSSLTCSNSGSVGRLDMAVE